MSETSEMLQSSSVARTPKSERLQRALEALKAKGPQIKEKVSSFGKREDVRKIKKGVAIAGAVALQLVDDGIPIAVAATSSVHHAQPSEYAVQPLKDADTTTWRRQFVKSKPHNQKYTVGRGLVTGSNIERKSTVANLRRAPSIPRTVRANVIPTPLNRPIVTANRR